MFGLVLSGFSFVWTFSDPKGVYFLLHAFGKHIFQKYFAI